MDEQLMFPETRLPQKPIEISRKFQRLSYIDINMSKYLPFCCEFGKQGIDGQFHVLYETLDKLSNKNYIGIHSSDCDDQIYIGSGRSLRRAIRKNGRHNFERFNLAYFEHRQHLVFAEGLIVNSWFVNQNTNYNINIGCWKNNMVKLLHE